MQTNQQWSKSWTKLTNLVTIHLAFEHYADPSGTLLLSGWKITLPAMADKKHICYRLICQHFLDVLGNPILSTSLPGEMVEEYTDPESIYEKFSHLVDLVVDGGPGGMVPSTIIDCTTDDWTIVRQGLGEWVG